jgi:transposase
VLSTEPINEIHRLYHGEHWSMRKIARHLQLAPKTVKKYLLAPAQAPVLRPRVSKLDPFKATLLELLQHDPTASAVVLLHRLRPLGYQGGITIVRDRVSRLRAKLSPPRAFVRMEPGPGERFEIDWGYFGSLDYQGDSRRLYAFCLVECHSRLLYVEFTHSQSFETFVRCHQHAFQALAGVARECWYDNLATAVAEHDGSLVRFHPRFLAFAREYGFYPRACNQAAGWEKGKVERSVAYLRQSFWPLRSFTDLTDVNRQVREWLKEVAHQHLHRETRQRPIDRFRPDALRPLPTLVPDYRDTTEAVVHKDLRLHFDGNRYCAPPYLVGQCLVVRADASSVTLYHQDREVVRYPRSWRRGQTFGAERFEKELFAQRAAAQRSQAQQRLLAWLSGACPAEAVQSFLRGVADSGRSLTRQIAELLDLLRYYPPESVAAALQKALSARAFGADYIANILRQQQSPREPQPPLRLKDPELNELATDPLSLLDYDSFILRSRKDSHDSPGTETPATEPLGDEPPTGESPGGGRDKES